MNDEAELSFEKSIERLAHIVEELERGDLPLETSLALFEEGVKLARASQKRLSSAEKRIEELLSVSSSGQAETRPLPTSSGLLGRAGYGVLFASIDAWPGSDRTTTSRPSAGTPNLWRPGGRSDSPPFTSSWRSRRIPPSPARSSTRTG
jgi:exodeoxyribonuclease VII small subunit